LIEIDDIMKLLSIAKKIKENFKAGRCGYHPASKEGCSNRDESGVPEPVG
jgi:hypothetical protein